MVSNTWQKLKVFISRINESLVPVAWDFTLMIFKDGDSFLLYALLEWAN